MYNSKAATNGQITITHEDDLQVEDYLDALSQTLQEWLSDEDEEAWRDL